MKILTKYISTTTKSYRITNYDNYTNNLKIHQIINYLPKNTPLYPNINIIDYLNFIYQIQHIPKSKRTKRITNIINHYNLRTITHKNINTLSKKFQQHIKLTQTIIHEPPILILNKPTNKLNPNQIIKIQNLIKKLNKDHTIILNTHNLPKIQITYTHIIIISNKQKVTNKTTKKLQQTNEQTHFIITIHLPDKTNKTTTLNNLQKITTVTKITSIKTTNNTLHTTITTTNNTNLSKTIYQQTITNN